MEMTLNKEFCEMSQDEVMVTDGGIGFLAACAAVTAACAAGYGCYELGAAVGKFIKNVTS